jgi:hypothetical protein
MEPINNLADSRSGFMAATPAQVFAAMSDPARVARSRGPDGTDYPNERRFTRIVPAELFEFEHLSGHHFVGADLAALSKAPSDAKSLPTGLKPTVLPPNPFLCHL